MYNVLIILGVIGILIMGLMIYPGGSEVLKNSISKINGFVITPIFTQEKFSCQKELEDKINYLKEKLSQGNYIEIVDIQNFKTKEQAEDFIETNDMIRNKAAMIGNLREKIPENQKQISIILINHKIQREGSEFEEVVEYSCDGKKSVLLGSYDTRTIVIS